MQIIGVGTDIIEITRIKNAMQNPKFADKVFTAAEQEYIAIHSDMQTAAGMFAAKEAVVKSVGTGFGTVSPLDVQILHNVAGQPYATVSGFSELKFFLSVSHCREYASAFAVAVKRE